jgi:hypothetical protein
VDRHSKLNFRCSAAAKSGETGAIDYINKGIRETLTSKVMWVLWVSGRRPLNTGMAHYMRM